jgi:hypothetical protein
MSKKNIRAALKAKGEELKKKYPKSRKPLICALCGVTIPYGSMLAHKEEVHGEKRVTLSPARVIKSDGWVSVFQGGLPSLGRNSK